MFRKRWFRDAAISDDGFEIRLLGRSGIQYEEGGRTLKIGAERQLDGGIILCRSPLYTWDAPHGADKLSGAEWTRILGNTIQALEFLGIVVEFE